MKTYIKKFGYSFPEFTISGSVEKIKYPAIAQIKYDGEVCQVAIEDSCILYSEPRIGRIREECVITNDLNNMGFDKTILLGELYYGDGKNMFQFLTHKLDNGLKLAVFDILKYNGKSTRSLTLEERLLILRKKIKNSEHVHLPDSFMCYNHADVEAYFEEAVSKNHEGIIVKSLCGTLKNNNLKDQAIIYDECFSTLPILGFSKNTKRNSLLVGYINPGSGKVEPLSQCKLNCSETDIKQLRSVLSNFVANESEAYYLLNQEQWLMGQIHHFGVLYNLRGTTPYGLRKAEFIKLMPNKTIKDLFL